MADVELVIKLPEDVYKEIVWCCNANLNSGSLVDRAIVNGTPLNNMSEQAEVQTYLAGYIKGCEQGREDLIDEVLNKVSEIPTCERDGCCVKNDVYRVFEEIINKE